ncbi:MAG TPA: alpha,alpha-trehalase TreF [Rhodanobacteraceae bacterium]|nr:alpha,alpha-trehalase TreF [Rhodanobacteraceae bacterium]
MSEIGITRDGFLNGELSHGAEWDVDSVPRADPLTPDVRYQELFAEVQMRRVYPDGKIFADCSPNRDPEEILSEYRSHRQRAGFDLKRFVHANFTEQKPDSKACVAPKGRPLKEHIDALWDVLARKPEQHPAFSSLLPLPRTYVMPGGRFSEFYYWDTTFTMLGLAASGRRDLMQDMAEDFAYLTETCGHVPNGNRTYYRSRSQPPLFAYVFELFEQHQFRCATQFLPALRKEYAYWMSGAGYLDAGEQHDRVVRLDDGSLLNRYWDDRDTPREAGYREDVLTARKSGRRPAEVFRETRSVGASGWDFSSRWFEDPQDLATVRITRLLPVDLNCFLHKLETVIADFSERAGDPVSAVYFHDAAEARAKAIDKFFWNAKRKAYLDYDWEKKQPRERINAATATPLFCGLASAGQAQGVAATIRGELLDPGGLATTTIKNGQQWDQPNGWAPLQWIAIQGLKRYGEDALADDIATRWLDTVARVYMQTGKFVEKYDLRAIQPGGGGEYEVQDGFGWTNGVTRALIQQYPDHPAAAAKAAAQRKPPVD